MGGNANCRFAFYRTLYHHHHCHHYYNLLLVHLTNPAQKWKCGQFFIGSQDFRIDSWKFPFFFFFFFTNKEPTKKWHISSPPTSCIHILYFLLLSVPSTIHNNHSPSYSLNPQWLLILSTRTGDNHDSQEHQVRYILSQYCTQWCVLFMAQLDYDTW